MREIYINNKRYWTNLIDGESITKCISFLSDGCSSYAISFGNDKANAITEQKIEGFEALLLRKMNFERCLLPDRAKDLRDSNKVLEKGLDLIELL